MQVPVGAFISAAVLDLVPGGRSAATTLIGVGAAGAVPAIAAGLADWSEMTKDRRRVGLVHAAANTVAVSLLRRFPGRSAVRPSGPGQGAGLRRPVAAGAGAYLGGHLAFAQGGGMNQAAPDIGRIPEEWTAVAQLA